MKLTLMLLVAFLLGSGVANGQQTVASVDDIPIPGVADAAAYFDSASGDIYLALGESIVLVGVDMAPFGFLSDTFDPTLVNSTTALGAPGQNDSEGIAWLAPLRDANGLSLSDAGFDSDTLDFVPFQSGVFNLGGLLPANPSIQTVADFNLIYPDARLSFAIPGDVTRDPFNVVESTISFQLVSAPASSIPEPGSLSLLLMTGIAATFRRTRSVLKS